jgi:hypothetical protein
MLPCMDPLLSFDDRSRSGRPQITAASRVRPCAEQTGASQPGVMSPGAQAIRPDAATLALGKLVIKHQRACCHPDVLGWSASQHTLAPGPSRRLVRGGGPSPGRRRRRRPRQGGARGRGPQGGKRPRRAAAGAATGAATPAPTAAVLANAGADDRASAAAPPGPAPSQTPAHRRPAPV